MPDPGEIVEARARAGPGRRRARAARRRDHQPQLPGPIRRPRLRPAPAGPRHRAARDRPRLPSGSRASRPRGSGSPRRSCGRCRLPRHRVPRRRPIDAARLRAAPGVGRRARCAPSMTRGLSLPTRFWVPELLDEYARIVGDRGARAAGRVRARAGARRAGRGGAAARRPGPVPRRSPRRQPDLALRRARPRDPGRLGVRGDGPPVFDLGNLAINNEFDEAARGAAARGLFRRAADGSLDAAALALMRIMSDAREARLGRGPGRDLRARVRLRRLRRTAFRAAQRAAATATRRLRGVAQMARPRELPPERADRDHRRRRRRRLDRLPPRPARRARRRPGRPQRAHERLDVPLGGSRRSAARRASR